MSRLGSLLADWSDAWSNLEPDRRNGVLLFGGLGLVVLIAVAIIGYGYYSEKVAYKNDTLLTVGEREFSYSAVERRLTRELRRGGLATGSASEAALSAVLLIEEEEVLRQGGRDLGLVVSDEELDDNLHGRLGVPAEAPPGEFAEVYRRSVLDSGLSVSEYRELVARDILTQKVRDHFAAPIPTEGEQVDLLLIRTRDRPTAEEAKQRLDDGDPFAEVATDASDHASAAEGGAAGWFPQGSLPSRVNDAAFGLSPGETSEIIDVSGAFGEPTYFYIVQPVTREVRAIDDDARDDIIDQAYQEFLVETSDRVGVTRSLTTKHLTELAKHAIAVVSGG